MFVIYIAAAIAASLTLGTAGQESKCFTSMQSSTLPNNQFLGSAGQTSTQSTSNSQNCGAQYGECFLANNIPHVTNPGFLVSSNSVCREMLRYTIPPAIAMPPTSSPTTSGASEKCAPTDFTNPCACQLNQAAGSASNITFKLALTQTTCCNQCSCVGDPHCVSFTGALDDWVVCNARDPQTCAFDDSLCTSASFLVNGQENSCQVVTDKQGNPGCLPNPSGPMPVMDFYTKVYLDMQSNSQYKMTITLQLGNLGVITCITASYGPVNGNVEQSYTVCTPQNGGNNIEPGSKTGDRVALAISSAFASRTKVQMTIKLMNLGQIAERLEITIADKDKNDYTPSGFCSTGVIDERASSIPRNSSCMPSDTFVFKMMCNNKLLKNNNQCGPRSRTPTQVTAEKRSFCNSNFPNSQTADCLAQPWPIYICKLECGNNGNTPCEDRCMYLMQILPNDVVLGLKKTAAPTAQGTLAPTTPPTPCPSAQGTHQFISSGGTQGGPLVNGVPDPTSYIYIQQQTGANTWGSPLLWFTEAQLACGQQIPVTNSASQLYNAGKTYRVLQCQQATTRCGPKVVDASISVTFSQGYPSNSGLSKQLRPMYDGGNLICNPSAYPNCPSQYVCCVWGSDSYAQWVSCMQENHPDFVSNPSAPCLPQ